MAEETPKFDPKLEEGIAYFEKMLQVMPEDRTTLEFLCVAYGQIGEPVKQRKALISLAGVLLKEKDLESADSIAERLAQYREPDAQAAVLRIRAAHGMGLGPAIADPQPTAPGATDDQPSGGNPQTAALLIAIKAEKELIQTLALRKILDESTADEALRRLAELSGMSGCFLVSALSVLEKENAGFGEMAMAAVAGEAGAPPSPHSSAFCFASAVIPFEASTCTTDAPAFAAAAVAPPVYAKRLSTRTGRPASRISFENHSQLTACSGNSPVCLKLKGFKLKRRSP